MELEFDSDALSPHPTFVLENASVDVRALIACEGK